MSAADTATWPHQISSKQEVVVILHGIFRSSSHMEPIAELLVDKLILIDYPSTKYQITQLADIVYRDNLSQIDSGVREILLVIQWVVC